VSDRLVERSSSAIILRRNKHFLFEIGLLVIRCDFGVPETGLKIHFLGRALKSVSTKHLKQ